MDPRLKLLKGELALARSDVLRRQIELDMPDGTVQKIRTVKDALRWVETHADA